MESVIKFISTTQAKLPQLEVVNGQLIFVEDTRRIYLDFHGLRTQYADFIYLSTEEQRKGLQYPLDAFYFVYETNLLWRYDSALEKWMQVTDTPKEQIVFLDTQDFPRVGDPSRIYISDKDIYRWRDGEYQLIGSSYWKSL